MVGLKTSFRVLFHMILLSDEYYFEDTDPEGHQGEIIDDLCDEIADSFAEELHHFFRLHKDEIEKGLGINLDYIRIGVIEKIGQAFKLAIEVERHKNNKEE